MSHVVSAVGSVVSGVASAIGLGGGAPKANGSAATGEVDTAAKRAAQARSQLFETLGGAAGQQLAPGQTSQSSTLFGN